MVLTKSISRFSGNTVDTLNAISELKTKGIGVYFEKEQIWTMDSKNEFIITLMFSLTQEESRSMSENVLWALRKRYAQGKGSFASSGILGLDRVKEKFEIVVNCEETVIVCKIFRMLLQGLTPHTIAATLTAMEIPTPAGFDVWSVATVRRMFSNEKHKGGMLLQIFYSKMVQNNPRNTVKVERGLNMFLENGLFNKSVTEKITVTVYLFTKRINILDFSCEMHYDIESKLRRNNDVCKLQQIVEKTD